MGLPRATTLVVAALIVPDTALAVKCLRGLGGPPTMFEAVRFDKHSGDYRPCSPDTAELGCEALYTRTAREDECPEVEIMYDGYSGTAAGYCETYTLNISAALNSSSTPWLGSDGAGQLTYSQCQTEPMNLKPGHQHACERQHSLRIDGGLAWGLEKQLQHEFSDTSSPVFIAAKECCSTNAEDESACNARYADSIPIQVTEMQGGLGGLVIIVVVGLAYALCRKCKACNCQGCADGAGQPYEKVTQRQVVDELRKTNSKQKLKTAPGRFRATAEQCPKPLPEGTIVTVNSVEEVDTNGAPWLPVSVSKANGEVVEGYLPKSAVDVLETATPPSC